MVQNKTETGYDKDYEDKISKLEAALDGVLESGSLIEAKEFAADALDVDLDDYTVEEIDLEEANEAGDFLNYESEYA